MVVPRIKPRQYLPRVMPRGMLTWQVTVHPIQLFIYYFKNIFIFKKKNFGWINVYKGEFLFFVDVLDVWSILGPQWTLYKRGLNRVLLRISISIKHQGVGKKQNIKDCFLSIKSQAVLQTSI